MHRDSQINLFNLSDDQFLIYLKNKYNVKYLADLILLDIDQIDYDRIMKLRID